MPAFNSERTIASSVSSVLAQTHCDTSLLVYDDGSTDSTASLVSEIARADRRVSIIRSSTNRGRGYARRALLEEAAKSLIAWQDSDDIWHPDKLRSQLRAYLRRASDMGSGAFVLLSTLTRVFRPHNTAVSRPDRSILGKAWAKALIPPRQFDIEHIYSTRFAECPFQLQATLAPATVYHRCGSFDSALKWAEDMDLAIRLNLCGIPILGHRSRIPVATYFVNEPSVSARELHDNITHIVTRYRHRRALRNVDVDGNLFWRRMNYIFKMALVKQDYDFAKELLAIAASGRLSRQQRELVQSNAGLLQKSFARTRDRVR